MAEKMHRNIYDLQGVRVRLNLHPGQTIAWDSPRRMVFIIAGTQSGKTAFGPWWLEREIRNCGSGDYLAVTATYDLFKLKMLPEIRRVFEGIFGTWTYQANDRVLYSNDTVSRRNATTKAETRVILRSANSPGGLESATALAVWADECGQDEFILPSWEAIQRRVSLSQGRILGTTTPYNLGWLKTEIYDRWASGEQDIQVVSFSSIMNPEFPRDEYDRAKRVLAPWKFAMFYNGQFSRPAGMIYDCFLDKHRIDPFMIPANWPRYGGLDFGGVHTAAVCYAEDPVTKALYLCREYLQGERTAAEHAAELKTWGCRLWVGGSKSEGQWRHEFAQAGLPIAEPSISDVEVGISRVYAMHKTDMLYVFSSASRYLDEKGRYSRELDRSGQPTEAIHNKNDYHLMDAERYIIGKICGNYAPLVVQPDQASRWREHEQTGDNSRWRRY